MHICFVNLFACCSFEVFFVARVDLRQLTGPYAWHGEKQIHLACRVALRTHGPVEGASCTAELVTFHLRQILARKGVRFTVWRRFRTLRVILLFSWYVTELVWLVCAVIG